MSRLGFAALALTAVVAGHAGPAAAGATAKPRSNTLSYYYDGFEQSFVRPITRATDAALLVRKLAGNRREAANVDEHDQVRLPSTWWQPRLGFRPVTPEQMMLGPGSGGPAPGKLTVIKMKTQGVTPGFQILDADSQKFAVKFDPPDYPEMATAADVITCYLYWAAGYNAPENSILQFRREDLKISSKATYEDARGRKHPITEADVDRILARVHRGADGTFRAVASRFLPPKLGEWEYNGRRRDDPEDLIPHQHRRDVRGLWTLYAWTNNTDCSARNTYDAWVTENGRSFVRHYLIDFSGAMGSASIGPQSYRGGFEYLMDFSVAAGAIGTLGLKPPPWEHVVDPKLTSVGFIESRAFDPVSWRPFLPNPAFDERTDRDVRWGARIVAAFTDDHIRTAVAAGKFSDPRAAEYLTRVLIERRDKIARRWVGGNSIAGAPPR